MNTLILKRTESSGEYTLGYLELNGNELCKTFELPFKDNEKNISCIPAGSYTLSPYPSSKFGAVYIINNVPNRNGILIHTGNTADDIEGCILVGDSFSIINGKKAVMNSKKTFSKLKKVLGNSEYIFKVEYK